MNVRFVKSQHQNIDAQEIEIVERKGWGHPDTLADGAANAVSYAYCRYCLKHFGHILHHNVDKTSLLGGESVAGPGFGNLVKPIRVMINGRMSTAFGNEEIPIFEIASNAVKKYLTKVIPSLNPETDMQIYDFLNRAGGPPHKGRNWFRPRSEVDLPEIQDPIANDTVCSIGFWPLSKLEHLVLNVELLFYHNLFDRKFKYIGSDIKTMAVRMGKNVFLTLCIPFIGEKTPSLEFYREKLNDIRQMILTYVGKQLGAEYRVKLDLNTRDNEPRNDHFILAKGTALESGDEGIVGRGNNSSGFIPSLRPYSMEAPAGKNPVYFAGKVYDYYTKRIAKAISEALSCPTIVYIITHSGTSLLDPSHIIVELEKQDSKSIKVSREFINHEFTTIYNCADLILEEQRKLFGFLDKEEP